MPLDAGAFYESQSPTLLALQPVDIDIEGQQAGKDWTEIFAALESRLASLRLWRYSWWSYWAVLAQYILPRRYRWLVQPGIMDKGVPINDSIIDSTASQAMQVCGSGMWTGLTSPSRPWFKLALGLPWVTLDAEGKAWLEDTQERIYAVLAGSNFYNIMAQAFQDVATFGTAPVVMYEDAEDVIRCYLPCAGEYYLAVSGRLAVDTFYREFTMTVSAIVDMFGIEACPAAIRAAWDQGARQLDNEYVVAHAIEPNVEIMGRGRGTKPIKVVPGKFTWREVYWLKGIKTEAELSRRGFNERPFFVARWAITSNDPYGRSPGMDALGDTKQLQLETLRKAEFIEKLVRPPMTAGPDMKNEPSSILPGHITYTNTEGGKAGFKPAFEVHPQALAPLVGDIAEVQKRIERAFFVDVFMAISRMEGVQPRNELEITKRDLERLQVLGPFVQLFETECASPAIERVMAILERRRALLPRPESLRGVPVKIDYRSMMKIAQEAAETASLERTFAVAGNLSAAAKAAGVPDPIRTIDLDKALKEYGERVSVPESIFFSADQVAAHDAERAKVTQQQQMLQATPPMVDAAKNLSEIQTGGGQNALTSMFGGGAAV